MTVALERLRLRDLSDREVLLAMLDEGQGDWITSHQLAARLGMNGDHPHMMAAQRLSWLRRYGVVEREVLTDEHTGEPIYTSSGLLKYGQRWRPNDAGVALAEGHLKAAQEKAIASLDDATAVLLAAALADHSRASGGIGSRLIRREWQHHWDRT